MKKHLLFLLLAMSMPLFAQTTYTTTTDGCGGKQYQYCLLPVINNQTGQPLSLVIDNRVGTTGPLGTLTVKDPYPGTNLYLQTHGTYSGFVANPDGSRNPFYGSASFDSDDGTVSGAFQYYAYYVATCSGRGCGGTLGWHYRINTGSTVTAQ